MSLSGDWFVGKAAASVVVSHPHLELLEIFTTHVCFQPASWRFSVEPDFRCTFKFIAGGGDIGPEHLRAHRLIHAWEYAKLVQAAASNGHYVVAVSACMFSIFDSFLFVRRLVTAMAFLIH
jgi:sphingomyelin phosphodiesterase 2